MGVSPGGGRRSKPAASSRRLADPRDCICLITGREGGATGQHKDAAGRFSHLM